MNRLADGTEYVGQLGQIAYDETDDKVQCHLCGRWFRGFGGSHLRRVHGWTLAQYRLAFQLSLTTAAVSAGTSALLAAHTRRRVQAGELPPRHRQRRRRRSGARSPDGGSRRAGRWALGETMSIRVLGGATGRSMSLVWALNDYLPEDGGPSLMARLAALPTDPAEAVLGAIEDEDLWESLGEETPSGWAFAWPEDATAVGLRGLIAPRHDALAA
jgi:hypothetical protein